MRTLYEEEKMKAFLEEAEDEFTELLQGVYAVIKLYIVNSECRTPYIERLSKDEVNGITNEALQMLLENAKAKAGIKCSK